MQASSASDGVAIETADSPPALSDLISSGRTSALPLIGLPKKRVDFEPKNSIIEPSSTNLNAEITLRRTGSSSLRWPPASGGVVARVQRHFKKALVRLRHVFAQKPSDDRIEQVQVTSGDDGTTSWPSRRRVVRRDSNAASAKRLASGTKRSQLDAFESSADDADGQRFSDEHDIDIERITSELADIFEHLSVAVRRKRARLDWPAQ